MKFTAIASVLLLPLASATPDPPDPAGFNSCELYPPSNPFSEGFHVAACVLIDIFDGDNECIGGDFPEFKLSCALALQEIGKKSADIKLCPGTELEFPFSVAAKKFPFFRYVSGLRLFSEDTKIECECEGEGDKDCKFYRNNDNDDTEGDACSVFNMDRLDGKIEIKGVSWIDQVGGTDYSMEKNLITHSNRAYDPFPELNGESFSLDLKDDSYDIKIDGKVKTSKSCKSAKSARRRELSSRGGNRVNSHKNMAKQGPFRNTRSLEEVDVAADDVEWYECPAEVNFTCGDESELREDALDALPDIKDIACMEYEILTDFPATVYKDNVTDILDENVPAGVLTEGDYDDIWNLLIGTFDTNKNTIIEANEFKVACGSNRTIEA